MKELDKEYIADIRDLSHEGLGVATVHGKTVFIEGALPHEQVSFVYIKKKSKFNIGRTIQVLKSSPIRTQPVCTYYGTCGGCSMQHVNSNEQIEIKQNRFINQLKHFGGVIPETILPAILGPAYHYRRRAKLTVQWNQHSQAIELGYKAKLSHKLVPIDHCEILASPLSGLLSKLITILSQLSIRKEIIQLEMAMGDNRGENQSAVLLQHKGILSPQDTDILLSFAKNENISLNPIFLSIIPWVQNVILNPSVRLKLK
jgi:23S rRNA (uracil1939-C5)-methyltransferase